ncbi:MAG TPA: hypothetical protein VLI06_03900 [Solimonas sp.]|nr:hypothetical protein [Solimonas sp.]
MIHKIGPLLVCALLAAPAYGGSATPDAHCNAVYGNAPQRLTQSPTAIPARVTALLGECTLTGGEILDWSDADGTRRKACLHVPAQASATAPLPLVIFLQASILPAEPQNLMSNFVFQYRFADLSGDPQRPGFILLTPYGRDTSHFYPFPAQTGLGYDHWYRNLDRTDPALNVDVAAIDHYIAEVKARGIVDEKRVYATGWSNGAAMGLLYGLNTPGIAATAVYSSSDPFQDERDPCGQKPFASNPRPVMLVHNDCDLGGFCQTANVTFSQAMRENLPQVTLRPAIINVLQQEVYACVALCRNPSFIISPGLPRHTLWPTLWNDDFFGFLREHPLP